MCSKAAHTAREGGGGGGGGGETRTSASLALVVPDRLGINDKVPKLQHVAALHVSAVLTCAPLHDLELCLHGLMYQVLRIAAADTHSSKHRYVTVSGYR